MRYVRIISNNSSFFTTDNASNDVKDNNINKGVMSDNDVNEIIDIACR
jgi:hypothetical protein